MMNESPKKIAVPTLYFIVHGTLAVRGTLDMSCRLVFSPVYLLGNREYE